MEIERDIALGKIADYLLASVLVHVQYDDLIIIFG